MGKLSPQVLRGIYALGRMYLESGFYTPAERIFAGLIEIDEGETPAALGLAFTKFQREKYQEAIAVYKNLAQNKVYLGQARIGLACCFLAIGEKARAKAILEEQLRDTDHTSSDSAELVQSLISLRDGV